MSLVNDMLKDLEERRRQQGAEQRPDLEGVISAPLPRRNNGLLWAGLGVLLLLPLAGGYWFVQQKPSTVTLPATAPATETAKHSLSLVAEPSTATETLSVLPEAAPVAPPTHSAEQDQPVVQQPSAVVEADKAPQPLPTQAPEKNQPVVVAAAPAVQPELVTKRQEPAAVVTMDKAPREPSPRAEADSALRQAAEALRNNRLPEAETHLRRALSFDSTHLAAREQLTGLLLHQGRLSEGSDLLKEGVELHPRHLPFRQGYARLLVEQGLLEEARQLLLSGPPPNSLDPQFHGLLAALEQRLGHHPAAVELYDRLASAWPQRSAWWLGLGISLEAMDRRQEAAAAFTGALRSEDISVDLRRFADQRLASLQP